MNVPSLKEEWVNMSRGFEEMLTFSHFISSIEESIVKVNAQK